MAGGDRPQGNGMNNRILKESACVHSLTDSESNCVSRLSTSPCVLVASQYGWSGNGNMWSES